MWGWKGGKWAGKSQDTKGLECHHVGFEAWPDAWGAIRAVFKQRQEVNRAKFQKVFSSSPYMHDSRAETPSEGHRLQRAPAARIQCIFLAFFVLCCD